MYICVRAYRSFQLPAEGARGDLLTVQCVHVAQRSRVGEISRKSPSSPLVSVDGAHTWLRHQKPLWSRGRAVLQLLPELERASVGSMTALLTYDTFISHSINFLGCLVSLALVDHLLIAPYVKRHVPKDRDVRQARWFFTHAAANLVVVLTGARALAVMFTDPINAVDSRVYSDTSAFGAASAWPLTMINAVHFYHMVGGFQLTGADYFHHLLFIPALGIPGQILLWGAVEPGGACFISGLPGGISYFMLGLLKIGKLDTMSEKRITANLNCWIRVPGILLSSFLVYQAVLYGRHTLPMWPAVLQVILPFYNALYYCKQAVANYTVHYMTSLLKQDKLMHQRMEELSLAAEASLTTPTKNAIRCSWKEALAVPQRGC